MFLYYFDFDRAKVKLIYILNRSLQNSAGQIGNKKSVHTKL